MTALVCIADFEEQARRVLPRNALDYYASGADAMETLRDNERGYSRYRLRPRMLRNVAAVSTATTLLGQRVSSPLCVAPTAMQRMAAPDGELATARAAAAFGSCMVLSSWATTSIEDVAAAHQAALGGGLAALRWFQLYVYRDREITRGLIERAERCGYRAIVLTVDTPLLGKRRNDARHRFQLPPHLALANFSDLAKTTVAAAGSLDQSAADNASGLAQYVAAQIDPSLDWTAIAWIRSHTALPIVAKGIMTAEDARLAVQYGCDAIIVSNHGARQLDTVPATIDVLGEIVDAVRGSGVEVYVDGGVRRGTDVLKALALGARAVFVGRPVLWGLAVDGQRGVEAVLGILQEELVLAMRLSGCRSVGEIDRSLVRHAHASHL